MNTIAFVLGVFIVLHTVSSAMRIDALKNKWAACEYFLTMVSGGSGVMAWSFGGATFIHLIMLMTIFSYSLKKTIYQSIDYLQTFYPNVYAWILDKLNIYDRRQADAGART